MEVYPLSAKYTMIVGSIALDRVATPEAQSPLVLGGAASYASVASSYFAPTRLVGIVGRDFPAEHIALYKSHQIDIDGLETDEARKTFFWSGRYRAKFAGRDTLDLGLNCFEKFSPTIPASYRSTPYVMLGAIQPSLQLHVIEQMNTRPKRPFFLADTFDHWIKTAHDDVVQVLRKIDMLVINDEEAELLTGEDNPYRAGPALRKMGPSIVVIKRGAYGALLFHLAGHFVIPAFPIEKLVDPTGAGDSFAGALIGYMAVTNRTDFGALKKALAFASATASFTCESFSVKALSDAGRLEIDKRFRALVNMTRF